MDFRKLYPNFRLEKPKKEKMGPLKVKAVNLKISAKSTFRRFSNQGKSIGT